MLRSAAALTTMSRTMWLLRARSTCVIALASLACAGVFGQDFDSEVAPILVRHCLECHQGAEPSGGFSLQSDKSFRAGGDSGEVLDATDPMASLLLEKVTSGEMPPESTLSADEIDVILGWVTTGAKWGNQQTLDLYQFTTDQRAGYDWWSLQPIVDPPVPECEPAKSNPIDALIFGPIAARQHDDGAESRRPDAGASFIGSTARNSSRASIG